MTEHEEINTKHIGYPVFVEAARFLLVNWEVLTRPPQVPVNPYLPRSNKEVQLEPLAYNFAYVQSCDIAVSTLDNFLLQLCFGSYEKL